MDTKLKKTHKLTTLIISLIVLIPALILTALYPRMEEQYFEKREKYGNVTVVLLLDGFFGLDIKCLLF